MLRFLLDVCLFLEKLSHINKLLQPFIDDFKNDIRFYFESQLIELNQKFLELREVWLQKI